LSDITAGRTFWVQKLRQSMSILYSKASLGPLALQNHLVMCPLTRNRATNNVPNGFMAEYYAQRASVGLIITEGTSPSPNGLGYPRIPGIYSQEQVHCWKRVVDAVHAEGAKIFIQFMHCGRIVHELNLPKGALALAPSAIAAAGEMYTDAQGLKPFPTPQAMTGSRHQDRHRGVRARCEERHAGRVRRR
jgi:N-ethylmaleimide reductase